MDAVAPFNNLCQLTKSSCLLRKHFGNSPILNGFIKNAEAIDQLAEKSQFYDSDEALIRIVRQNTDRLHWLCDEWLNTGHFSALPDEYRLLYAFCCAIRAKFCFVLKDYFLSLRHCDEGLLKGNDLEDEMPEHRSESICAPNSLPNSVQIVSAEMPALEEFYNNFYRPQMPVVIRGMVSGWPAFEKWSFSYLNSLCGHRLVPVELGSKYTDEDWRQLLMSFNQYLTEYVFPAVKPAQPGYMAQHRLLDQIPELLADVPVPDYCVFGEHSEGKSVGDGAVIESDHDLTINAFIGPAGTVSPLHTDPRHNLFCQIRGRKFVRLISPQNRCALYLYDDLMRQNTSQVDVECPDFEQFPDFGKIQCHDFVVEAGQCLFIPRGWFHHVRALEPSISISIWFGHSARREVVADSEGDSKRTEQNPDH
uniref:JmjC domain-containing protein n=1 Tax=Globodera rostochiensis TaxID=31243 RepID=A0A914GXI7_GLORO